MARHRPGGVVPTSTSASMVTTASSTNTICSGDTAGIGITLSPRTGGTVAFVVSPKSRQ